jgi:hypothetical protein
MDNPKHINDLKAKNERKKARNAINQRDFRKRMKNRMNEVMNQNNTENVSCSYPKSSLLFISKY